MAALGAVGRAHAARLRAGRRRPGLGPPLAARRLRHPRGAPGGARRLPRPAPRPRRRRDPQRALRVAPPLGQGRLGRGRTARRDRARDRRVHRRPRGRRRARPARSWPAGCGRSTSWRRATSASSTPTATRRRGSARCAPATSASPDAEFLPAALAMAVAFQECFDDDPLLPPELLPRPWPGPRGARAARAQPPARARDPRRRTTGPPSSEPSTTSSNRSPERSEPIRMKFGIFYEHQLPRPWDADDEHQLLKDALDQVELADRLGIDYVWEVEHHFLEEYSHSSAPEVFLAAASQRTSRIRLGHGIVQLPAGLQPHGPRRRAHRHPRPRLRRPGRLRHRRVVVGGRARRLRRRPGRRSASSGSEALDAVTRMFVEEPFAGYDGRFLQMPPRNVVPKPLQKPHPPLWVACRRQETIHLAADEGHRRAVVLVHRARRGRGRGSTTTTRTLAVRGVRARRVRGEPQPGGRAADHVPRGRGDGDRPRPRRRPLLRLLARCTTTSSATTSPGRTDIWDEFQENRSLFGFDRTIAAGPASTLGAS